MSNKPIVETVTAFDPGFGSSLAMSKGPDGKALFSEVQSVVGAGKLIEVSSAMTFGVQRSRKVIPHQVTFAGGVSYLIGEGVQRYATPIQRMDFLRLINGDEFKALLLGTIALGLDSAMRYKTKLLVGMPIEMLLDKKTAMTTKRQMMAWACKKHVFKVGKKVHHIEIASVDLAPQPLGALMAWGADEKGGWTSHIPARETYCVVDIGMNTVDCYTLENLAPSLRTTFGAKVGMRQVAENIIKEVRLLHGKKLSYSKADELMRHYLRIGKAKIYISGLEQPLEVTDLVRQSMHNGWSQIMQELESVGFNPADYASVIFAGGGASAHEASIKEAFPTAYVLGYESIVQGLYKLCVSKLK